MFQKRKLWAVLSAMCLATAVAAPRTARADDDIEVHSSGSESGGIRDGSVHTRPQMLSFFLILPWYSGFGVGLGARYMIPVAPQGFISNLNDSVEIEFGADFWAGFYGYGYGTPLEIGVPIEAMWTFHLTPKFSVYGKAGFGLQFGSYGYGGYGYYGGPAFGPYFIFGPGLLFKVGDSVYLRAEAGLHGIRGGIGFAF